MIEDWSTSDPHSHLEGGMKYKDGKLVVPKTGMYFIYANLQFGSKGQVQIRVNNDTFLSLITSPVTRKRKYATANKLGLFFLNANDTFFLQIYSSRAPSDNLVKFWMDYYHCYFGAFLT